MPKPSSQQDSASAEAGTDDDFDATKSPLLQPLALLSRDIRRTAALTERTDAGFLVDMYYREQEARKRLGNQVRSLKEAGKSTDVISHFYAQSVQTEAQIKSVLGAWVKKYPEGQWALSITGIGPVLAAGFSAYIKIEKCPTVGHLHSYAGLNPNRDWNKGELRPWNADLKVLCWKIGKSFVKNSNREDCYYGKLYRQRKLYEMRNNQSGRLSAQAAQTLIDKKITDPPTLACYMGDNTKCAHTGPLMVGRPEGDIGPIPHLPPGRIDNRAARWACKLYMSHWWGFAYRAHFGEAEPLPYPIAHLDHVDYLEIPNLPDEYKFPRSTGGFWNRNGEVVPG